jgi:WD40-like Beta Propeller Repeat
MRCPGRCQAQGQWNPLSQLHHLCHDVVNPWSIAASSYGGGGGEALAEDEISWSRDSHALAFLPNAEIPEQLQLPVANLTGGKPRKLTSLTGSMEMPGWSSDGKTLGLLFTENAPRAPGMQKPMTPPAGEIGAKVY